MGQCTSTLASEPDGRSGSPSKAPSAGAASAKPVFTLDVAAGLKAAEARAAASQAQPSSPGIAAAPSSSRSEGPEALVALAVGELPQPSSAGASSGTRARRLSLPGTVAGVRSMSDSGSLTSSDSGGGEGGEVCEVAVSRALSGSSSSGILPAELSAQPSLPEAHPLPSRRVRFDHSPVKTHHYESREAAEEEPQRVAAAARPPALQVGVEASQGSMSSMGSAGSPSPSRSALASELLQQRQQRMAAGGGSPSRAAAQAAVPMKDLLHSVASLSRAGKEPTYRKQNQDNCFAFSQYCRPNQALLAALDGHGPHGHSVSGYLKRQLPLVLADHLGESSRGCKAANSGSTAACCPCEGTATANASFTSTASTACSVSGSATQRTCACGRTGSGSGGSRDSGGGAGSSSGGVAALVDPAAALAATFLAVDRALPEEGGVNVQFSGSTAVVCLLRGRRLTTAWVGDSKAVLARQEPRGCRAIPLTRDHKPGQAEERARIAAKGGRVERLVDHRGQPVGPDRVWLPTSWVPGLAMSRALGDAVAHSVGVSSEPETSVVDVCAQDKFLILASDGVWEFIDPQGAVDIVCDCKDAEEACRRLVDASWAKWLREEEGVVDDITVVCVKFNP